MKSLIVIAITCLAASAFAQSHPDFGIPDDSSIVLFMSAQGGTLVAIPAGTEPRFLSVNAKETIEAMKSCPPPARTGTMRNDLPEFCNYKFLTGGSIRSIINILMDENARLQKENKAVSDDYNLLAGKYNRLAAISHVSYEAPRQYDSRALSVLSFWQAMQPRPSQKIDLQVTDCTRYPALCVH